METVWTRREVGKRPVYRKKVMSNYLDYVTKLEIVGRNCGWYGEAISTWGYDGVCGRARCYGTRCALDGLYSCWH